MTPEASEAELQKRKVMVALGFGEDEVAFAKAVAFAHTVAQRHMATGCPCCGHGEHYEPMVEEWF